MKTKVLLFLLSVGLVLSSCKAPITPETVLNYQETNSSNYTITTGQIELDGTLPFADQVTENNKTYVVRDGFDLAEENVTLPSGSTLQFFGGSISNGKVTFNNTEIKGYAKFINCSYEGTISNDTVELEWFDLTSKEEKHKDQLYSIPGSNELKFPYYDTKLIQQIIDCAKAGSIIKVDKQYVLANGALTINKKITFEGLDKNEGIYSTLLNNFQYGFASTAYNSAFVIKNGGEISMTGISVLGNVNFYIGQFTWEKEYSSGAELKAPFATCGLDLEPGAKIDMIVNSSFTGFTYAIRSNGGTIGLVRNSYLSDSRYGLWAKDTEDFEFRGCRFNTNKLNFNFFKYDADYQSQKAQKNNLWSPITEADGEKMYKVGGGVYLENCKDVHINKCRFEFNFIHAMIIGSGKDVIFEGCIYDTATISQVLIHNVGEAVTSLAMDNITFNNSTFARGARCDVRGEQSTKGYGIVYITDIENRGSNINFTSNIISDNMEVDKNIDVQYEKYVFCINSTSTSDTNLNIKNNSFKSAEAEDMFHAVSTSSGTYNIEEKGNDYGNVHLLSGKSEIFNFTLRKNGDINEIYE